MILLELHYFTHTLQDARREWVRMLRSFVVSLSVFEPNRLEQMIKVAIEKREFSSDAITSGLNQFASSWLLHASANDQSSMVSSFSNSRHSLILDART